MELSLKGCSWPNNTGMARAICKMFGTEEAVNGVIVLPFDKNTILYWYRLCLLRLPCDKADGRSS